MVNFPDRGWQRALNARMLHLVRTNKRAAAKAVILGEIAKLPTELDLPLGCRAEIPDWDDLIAATIEAGNSSNARSETLEAVALDLINRRFFGTGDGRLPQRDEICIQVGFFSAPPGARQLSCPRRMLNRLSRPRYLWRRQPYPPVTLRLDGIDGLTSFQRSLHLSHSIASSDVEQAELLSGWLIWVEVVEALASMLEHEGLPTVLPVIVGVDQHDRPMESNSRDYGPRAETLLFASKAALDEAEERRILEERLAQEAERRLAYFRDILDGHQAMMKALNAPHQSSED